MAEGTSVQKHLNNFNSIVVDLESLDVKIVDEDKAILWVVSLPISDKHFKETMLYSNSDTILFEDVKSNCWLRKSLILTFMLILLRD